MASIQYNMQYTYPFEYLYIPAGKRAYIVLEYLQWIRPANSEDKGDDGDRTTSVFLIVTYINQMTHRQPYS